MQTSDDRTRERGGTVYEEYVLDVRIVEYDDGDGPRYRFDAPGHVEATFEDPEMATLYADVYFDTNGFREEGTGEVGVPPAIIQAGRDTLVAYFLTRPYGDRNWIASFYGERPEKIDRYVSRVRKRASKIREGVADRGIE